MWAHDENFLMATGLARFTVSEPGKAFMTRSRVGEVERARSVHPLREDKQDETEQEGRRSAFQRG